jgi:hypothetical protein
MRFRPGDFEAANVVRDELIDRYDAWQRQRHPAAEVVDVAELGMLLDWKVGYGNGRFDAWAIGEVDEFLLDWCPRKLSVSPAEAR